MERVHHNGNTIVRRDPFDLERLLEQRAAATTYLENVKHCDANWEWRGIGCLRFKAPGSFKHLHVWHPYLLLPDIADGGGDIHEHLFTIVSDVLLGRIKHTWFDVAPTYRPLCSQTYDIYDFKISLQPYAQVETAADTLAITELSSYAFEAEQFHSSKLASDVAVTRCAKLNQFKGNARVLVLQGRKPAFSTPFEPLPEKTFKLVVDCAIAALEQA